MPDKLYHDFLLCVLDFLFMYYTFHTHTHTHVRVYATLHPQHRKTYYDDDVNVDSGDGSSALRSVHCSARWGIIRVCVRVFVYGCSFNVRGVLSLSTFSLLTTITTY